MARRRIIQPWASAVAGMAKATRSAAASGRRASFLILDSGNWREQRVVLRLDWMVLARWVGTVDGGQDRVSGAVNPRRLL
jgi:hypothetical protein